MEYSLEKSCYITNYFVGECRYTQDRLAYRLYEQVYKAVGEGYDTFYFGGCSEVDIIAAEQVLLRRVVIQQGDPKHIRLIAVIPYEDQRNDLELCWRERCQYILSRCDEVIVLHSHFMNGCIEEHIRYMIERCSRMIAVCDKISKGNYALAYAESKDISIVTVAIDG